MLVAQLLLGVVKRDKRRFLENFARNKILDLVVIIENTYHNNTITGKAVIIKIVLKQNIVLRCLVSK